MFETLKNIVGKGENAGYQHFLLFPTMFSKSISFMVVKSQDFVVKSYLPRMTLSADCVHQDQTAKSMQSDFASTLWGTKIFFQKKKHKGLTLKHSGFFL